VDDTQRPQDLHHARGDEAAVQIIPIDLGKGDQFTPEFTKINPNQKIPAIVDHDVPGAPRSVFESGAILIYLGEKTGKLLPAKEPSGARRSSGSCIK
jgi:GST-like protein